MHALTWTESATAAAAAAALALLSGRQLLPQLLRLHHKGLQGLKHSLGQVRRRRAAAALAAAASLPRLCPLQEGRRQEDLGREAPLAEEGHALLHAGVPLAWAGQGAAHHKHLVRVARLRKAIEEEELLVALGPVADPDLRPRRRQLGPGADECNVPRRLLLPPAAAPLRPQAKDGPAGGRRGVVVAKVEAGDDPLHHRHAAGPAAGAGRGVHRAGEGDGTGPGRRGRGVHEVTSW